MKFKFLPRKMDTRKKVPLPSSLFRSFAARLWQTWQCVDAPFYFNDDCVNAFRRLREALISAPINLWIGTFLSSWCVMRAITR